MQDIKSVLQYYSSYFDSQGVDSPRLSAELILAKALQLTRLDILANPKRSLTSEEIDLIAREMDRRAQGEPVAYILGHKEFYGYNFLVDRSVLIPRPETELVVDLIHRFFPLTKRLFYADIGTGSGVLGITIAVLYTYSSGIGTERSSPALDVVKGNIAKHGVQNRFFPVQCNLADCLEKQNLDLIVSNPPYLSFDQYKNLSREITEFEPREALIAGDKGTEIQESLFEQFAYSLKSGGSFFMEIDSSQGDYVYNLLKQNFKKWFAQVDMYKDFCGYNRVVGARKL